MALVRKSALLEVPVDFAYQVVLDVARYPEFLPGCDEVTVLETTLDGLVAEVRVAGKGLRESFITSNTHLPNEAVRMSLREGPFERLEGEWVFTPLGDIGCRVDMHIDFVARGLLARLLSTLADRVADRMVDAFSQRIVECERQGMYPVLPR